VTAEFAIAMPAVLLVLAVVLGGVQLGGLKLRLESAAAVAARLVARGSAAEPALAGVGAPASLTREDRDGLVCVRLSARPPGVADVLGIGVSGSGCAIAEGG